MLLRTSLLWFFLAIAWASPASAIPYFAHEYGLQCQKCHSVIPRLNPFGLAFMNHGFQLPGGRPDRGVVPVSTKLNLLYTGDRQPGLPKGVVDEVEVFLAGTAGPRNNYWIEQYLVDGGLPGATREAWFSHRFTAGGARTPVDLTAGSFTLPLPVDPESFRESYQDYAPFVENVGVNPFDFKAPKIGLQARAGDPGRGLSADLDALQGHDRQSGVAADGTDLMQYLQEVAGPVTLSTYRYEGRRPARVEDRFWRQGYGLVYQRGRWESDSVIQTGGDTSFDGLGTFARSSGGFEQLRYQVDPRFFLLARYEGTNDPANGFARDFVALVGARTTHNARVTFEDVIAHSPRTHNSFATQYTVGY